MSERERQAMREHVAYWTKLLEDGVAVAFGPVADPKGGYGAGIVELDAAAAALASIEANAPAIRAQIGLRYEVLPMARAIVRPR